MEDSDLYRERVTAEYENLKKIFEKASPEQVLLNDGLILETARIQVELDFLNDIVAKCGGRVVCNPKNPKQQKEIPASRTLEKARMQYRENMKYLTKVLGVNTDENEDGELSDYE